MDGEIKAIIEALQLKVETYEHDMSNDIKQMRIIIDEQTVVRQKMNTKLDKLKEHSIKTRENFDKHTAEEMVKYQETIDAIEELTKTMKQLIEDTTTNSDFVTQVQKEKEIKDAIKAHDEVKDLPMKEIKHKVFMVAVTIITGAVVTGIGSALWFGLEMYFVMFGD